jgi:hypothetical protein
MNHNQKLIALIQKELPALIDNLIIEDDDSFSVFGRYNLYSQDQGFGLYDRGNYKGDFTSTRSALAWCIADKYNDIVLSKQILNLDRDLHRHRLDLQSAQMQADITNSGQRWEILTGKISHRKSLIQSTQNQLSKCVDRAKYYQIRGFSNETSRTGRSVAN